MLTAGPPAISIPPNFEGLWKVVHRYGHFFAGFGQERAQPVRQFLAAGRRTASGKPAVGDHAYCSGRAQVCHHSPADKRKRTGYT